MLITNNQTLSHIKNEHSLIHNTYEHDLMLSTINHIPRINTIAFTQHVIMIYHALVHKTIYENQPTTTTSYIIIYSMEIASKRFKRHIKRTPESKDTTFQSLENINIL